MPLARRSSVDSLRTLNMEMYDILTKKKRGAPLTEEELAQFADFANVYEFYKTFVEKLIAE